MNYHRGQYLQSSMHDLFFVRSVQPSKNLITLWSYTAGQEIVWRLSAIKTAGYVVAATGDKDFRPSRRPPMKKTCKRNHQMSVENTYMDPKGTAVCRICKRTREKLLKDRYRAQRVQTPPPRGSVEACLQPR